MTVNAKTSGKRDMNQTERNLLGAIRKSLWNCDITFSDDTDWNAVLEEAQKQAILGIVYFVAPADVQRQWNSSSAHLMAHYIRILHAEKNLTELLEKHGIPTVVLKGTAAAIYYPVPSQRTMGDIDLIVPQDCFEQAKRLFVQEQYSISKEDPAYLRHIELKKDGVTVELHRFFHDDNVDVNVDAFIVDGISRAEKRIIDGTAFPMLPKLENGLVLLAHIALHLYAEIGLRQIIDWMLYADRELNDEYWESEFKKAAVSVGLDTFACVVTRMCQIYLGLSNRIHWCEDTDPDLCEELMNSVLSAGNFGAKRGSGRKIGMVTTQFRRKGTFQYLQQAGKRNWAAYQKHKWLKPFAWVYQICRYVRQGLGTNRGMKMTEDIERGIQRNELIRQLKIEKK